MKYINAGVDRFETVCCTATRDRVKKYLKQFLNEKLILAAQVKTK